MAHIVKTNLASHVDAGSKLQALLNGSTITTFRAAGITKISSDLFLIWIAYEGT